MKRIGYIGRVFCLSILFLNSKGYLYDFKRRKSIKLRKIGFEREDKEYYSHPR